MKKPVVKVEPFCFWETLSIGFHVTVDGVLYHHFDTSLEEAENLVASLQKAISSYKEMDKECSEYFLK